MSAAEIVVERPPDPTPRSEDRGAPVDQDANHRPDHPTPAPRPGETASADGWTLTSWRVAALPILDHFLRRLRLEEFLRDHLPREDRRSRVPTVTALLVLVRNLLVSREPLYGVGESGLT